MQLWVLNVFIKAFHSGRVVIALVLCLLALTLWGLRVSVVAPVDIGTGVLFFLLAATLPLAAYRPTVAALGHLALFAVASFSARSPDLVTLTSVLMVTVVTAQRRYKTGVVLAVFTTLLGFYSPDKKSFSVDSQSVTIFSLMMVCAFAVGWFINTVNTKERQRHLQIRQRKAEVAGLLHDTVAADLTALIVRLEALAIATPEIEQALQKCATTARKSIGGIRALVDELNAQAINHQQATVPALTTTLIQTNRALQEAGFHVESTANISVDPGTESIDKALSRCLSEASANIIKYAVPDSMVRMTATADAKQIIVTIANTYRPGRGRAGSSHFGLVSMQRTIAAVGGSMTLDSADARWSITFHVPV